MNRDQIKGRAREAAGEIQKGAGKITGDTETQLKGSAKKTAGKVQGAYGDAKENLRRKD